MHRPIDNCYWVEPGRLLAGEYPRTTDDTTSLVKLNALVDAGVRAFINLTEKDEGLLPYNTLLAQCNAADVTHERFGIRDLAVPRSHKHTASILNAIDRRIAEGRIVYVHCWGGVVPNFAIPTRRSIGERCEGGGSGVILRLRPLLRVGCGCDRGSGRRCPAWRSVQTVY